MAWFERLYRFVIDLRARARALVEPVKLWIRKLLRAGGDNWSRRTLRLIQRFRKSVRAAR
jgi:hypothetical protein